MNIPEIFKYNALISIPLFSIIALLLIKQTAVDFSFHKHTVSKSVNFLNKPTHTVIFRLNFVVKAILDLGFAWFLIDNFKISFWSPVAWLLVLPAVIFGSLAYFIEGKYTVLHKWLVYSGGVFWSVGQLFIARLTGDVTFIRITDIFITVPILLAFGFLFAKKTNVFVQIICMSIWYVWLLIFVFRYL